MPNLTTPIGKGFDAKRRVLLGTTATLALLNHAPGRGGYVKLKDVPDGWFLRRGGIGEPSQLEITETDEITTELLKKTVAFYAFGKVWKTVENNFESPLGETIRVWRFQVKPTGEKFFD